MLLNSSPNRRGFRAILDCPIDPAGGADAWGREVRSIPGLVQQARLREYGAGGLGERLERLSDVRTGLQAALDSTLAGRGIF